MYKNDRLIKEYEAVNPEYSALSHPPVEIDDFVGDAVEKGESFTKTQAALVKDLLNYGAVYILAGEGELSFDYVSNPQHVQQLIIETCSQYEMKRIQDERILWSSLSESQNDKE